MSFDINPAIEVIKRYQPQGFFPKMGIILGSGLSSLADQLTQAVSVPYQAIPGLKASGVQGHASLLMMGYLQNVPVIFLRGRVHYYEGHGYDSMKILIRLLKVLGCDSVLVTGAAGSLREEVPAGEVMLLSDHINLQGDHPLIGANDESVGPRFYSMDQAYDPGLMDIAERIAKQEQIKLPRGVYISVSGPSFETPAEIRAFRTWGADSVGMSVVPDVLIARHCGLRVLGLAAITNLAAGLSSEILTHEGTLHFGEVASRKLIKLIPAIVKAIYL